MISIISKYVYILIEQQFLPALKDVLDFAEL